MNDNNNLTVKNTDYYKRRMIELIESAIEFRNGLSCFPEGTLDDTMQEDVHELYLQLDTFLYCYDHKDTLSLIKVNKHE